MRFGEYGAFVDGDRTELDGPSRCMIRTRIRDVGRNLWICAIHGLRRSTDCAQQYHGLEYGAGRDLEYGEYGFGDTVR